METEGERISERPPQPMTGGALIREIMVPLTGEGNGVCGSGPTHDIFDLFWIDRGGETYCRLALILGGCQENPRLILRFRKEVSQDDSSLKDVWELERKGPLESWPWAEDLYRLEGRCSTDGQQTTIILESAEDARHVLTAMRDYYSRCRPSIQTILTGKPVGEDLLGSRLDALSEALTSLGEVATRMEGNLATLDEANAGLDRINEILSANPRPASNG